MTEFALASFTALFVTVNPIKVAALLPALTEKASTAERRAMALRATAIAGAILLVFALFGDDLLRVIGISLHGVRVGGGILLLILAIDIVFGHPIGPAEEGGPAAERADIAVFPLATPIIAGPGAITATIVQATEARNTVLTTLLLVAVVAAVMLLTLAALFAGSFIESALGPTGMSVVTRILGVLLAAVAAEMILTGIGDSGVFR